MENILENVKLATDILRDKPLLRRINGDAIVSGDLHGDIDALNQAIELRGRKNAKNMIFLGDYVDRGDHQLEVINELAKLIIDDPHTTVLRGNHEDLRVCGRYGFLDIVRSNNLPVKVFGDFFSQLPYAAISANGYFAHGGIPVDIDFHVNQIKSFERESIVGELPNAKQILWNDPIYDEPDIENIQQLPSPRGPGIYQFGIDVTKQFLKRHDINMIFRAHIAFIEGFKWMQNNTILSLFTSSSGSYSGKIGAKYKRMVAYVNLDDRKLNYEKIELIDISDK